MHNREPHSELDWPTTLAVGGTVLGLNVLLHVPALLFGTLPAEPTYYLSDPLRLHSLFSVELFGLACLLALVPDTGDPSPVRVIVGGSILVLLVYQTYEAVVVSMLHRPPIVYADAPHLVGAVYLLLNAGMPWPHVLGLGGGVGVIGILVWTLPTVIGHLHRHLRIPSVQRGMFAAAAGVGLLVVAGVATNRCPRGQTGTSVCSSTAAAAVRNVQASSALHDSLSRRRSRPADSTYVGYADLDWTRPPSLYLVVLESYGSILATAPYRASYDRLMTSVSDSLTRSGWHAVTGHSKAPVWGGLSWLSTGTMLLGTPVEHQPTFTMLRSTLSRYPHLVHLLQRKGYETATLQPPVRSRPGLEVENPYGFDRTFYLQDLHYDGPRDGWGIVPDQYSLAVAHEQFVKSTDGPFFLFFETATSHAPWNRPPPPLVADPSTLNHSRARPLDSSVSQVGSDDVSKLADLFRHIRYDWRVLADYLCTQAPPNSLVVILGDHQPYAATRATFATPLHVLSRDERLVRRFVDYGLAPGLRPSAEADTLHHAGVYSLLIRTLTAHDRSTAGRSADPLPPYRPRGVKRAALLPTRP